MNGVAAAASDPRLVGEIRRFGRFDTGACFACGSCVLACDLARDALVLPRRALRLVQLGLRGPAEAGLDPWLCHYCGDCSTRCPRQAEPGESLMTLRKWLSARYDWTGVTALLHRSRGWRIGALALVAGAVAARIGWWHRRVFTGEAELAAMFPMNRSHSVSRLEAYDGWVLLAVAALVCSNVARQVWFAVRDAREAGIGTGAWLRALGLTAWHVCTQPWLRRCGREDLRRWLGHLVFVSGFLVKFVLVVFFLSWFQTEAILPWTHPQRWLGYYVTAALVLSSLGILVGRSRTRDPAHRYSEFDDLLLPVLVLLTAVTGLASHVARYREMPVTTFVTFGLHLMSAYALVVVEVPFGKLGHLAYRPVALLLHEVREEASQARPATAAGGVPA